MTTLRVRLFGNFQVQLGEQTWVDFGVCKVEELFCYLLLYQNRSHSREALASLLWGDSSTVHSKGYLRKALWQLQTTLNSRTGSPGDRILLVEPDRVRINPESDLWLDVAEFEQSFNLVQGVPGKALGPRRVQTMRSAVDLYRGDLLDNWYQDWCLYERERLRHIYLAMLDKLVSYSEARHECEAGLAYGMRILHYDRARERTHRRLMRLHCLAGNRTAALRQYRRCVTALDEELGVKPARRTVALYNQIREDRFDALAPTPIEGGVTLQAVTSPLSKVLKRLKHLQANLENIQRQVHQDIQIVERALNDNQ